MGLSGCGLCPKSKCVFADLCVCVCVCVCLAPKQPSGVAKVLEALSRGLVGRSWHPPQHPHLVLSFLRGEGLLTAESTTWGWRRLSGSGEGSGWRRQGWG